MVAGCVFPMTAERGCSQNLSTLREVASCGSSCSMSDDLNEVNSHTEPPLSEPGHVTPNRYRHPVLIASITAVLGAVIGSAVTWGIPAAGHWWEDSHATTVVITSPSNEAQEPNNRFGASGYVSHPPDPVKSSLWLVVYSGGGYYPFGKLSLVDDQWSIASDQICTAVGFQDIAVYMVPNKDAGGLYAYVNNGSPNHPDPIARGMPLSAVRMAVSHVEVNPSSNPGC